MRTRMILLGVTLLAATATGRMLGHETRSFGGWRRRARSAATWAALGRGSLTVLRVSNPRQGPGRCRSRDPYSGSSPRAVASVEGTSFHGRKRPSG